MMHSAFAVYIVEIMCDGVHVYNIYIYMYDIIEVCSIHFQGMDNAHAS